jgi:hypothetical protein
VTSFTPALVLKVVLTLGPGKTLSRYADVLTRRKKPLGFEKA